MMMKKIFATLISGAMIFTGMSAMNATAVGIVDFTYPTQPTDTQPEDNNPVVKQPTTFITNTYTLDQSKDRKMLDMINKFRTSNTWVWNETNTQKIPVSGLGSVVYDYELEKTAMQRAAEIIAVYRHDHIRPNGSQARTAYPVIDGQGNGVYGFDNDDINYWMNYNAKYATKYGSMRRENIHIVPTGYNDSLQMDDYEVAFTDWVEENELYAGQGHRRNMLDPDVTCVGVAHVEYEGWSFWVQEFGTKKTDTAATKAVKSKTISVEVLDSTIASVDGELSFDNTALFLGTSTALPKLSAVYHLTTKNKEYDFLPDLTQIIDITDWVSSDPKVAAVENGEIAAKSIGSCTVSGTAYGKTYKVAVTVKDFAELSSSSVPVFLGTTEELPVLQYAQGYSSRLPVEKITDWKISDTSVAAIENGRLTPKKVGECQLTGTAYGRIYTAKIVVPDNGDISGNGKIDSTDLAIVMGDRKGTKVLSEDLKKQCDFNNDGVYNTLDQALLTDHLKGLRLLPSLANS